MTPPRTSRPLSKNRLRLVALTLALAFTGASAAFAAPEKWSAAIAKFTQAGAATAVGLAK
jgi:hypothetical protein